MSPGQTETTPNNQRRTKAANQALILDSLRQHPASRADLARLSGLSKAAITGLADQLLAQGLIRESTTAVTSAGRRPVLLDLNPDYGLEVVLNLSRIAYTLGLADFKGDIICKTELPRCMPDELLHMLPARINKILSPMQNLKKPVLGLGITAPGPLDSKKGAFLNPPDFTFWHGKNIVQPLAESLNLPVFLENNAMAAAIAEFFRGCANIYDNFLVLTVDSGIGAGLFLNRRPFTTTSGLGQEFGHMSIDWQGKPCSCGNRGCLERYAAIPEIIAEGQKLYGAAAPHSWPELVDRAIGQDYPAGKLLDLESEYLAAAIVSLRNLFEFDAVILTGDITYKPKTILTLMHNRIEQMSLTGNMRQMELRISAINRSDGLIGSAAIVLQHHKPVI